jgi:hypothetical protein
MNQRVFVDQRIIQARDVLGASFVELFVKPLSGGTETNGVVWIGTETTVGQQGVYLISTNTGASTFNVDFKGSICSHVCGNSIVEAGEQCDNGVNNDNNLACTAQCKNNVCGDGLTNIGFEMCDDNNSNTLDSCANGCLCQDSDSGNIPNINGVTKNFTSMKTDTCISGALANTPNLNEYICSGNVVVNVTRTCPYGCLSGKCKPAPGGGTCFLPDTMITTQNGDKMIKDIKVGDVVTSYNEVSNRIESNKVTELYTRETDSYLLINGKLKVTSNHPMFVNGKWMEIGRAKVGDKLKTLNGEEKIFSIKEVKGSVEVFNLEVEKSHTYYAQGYLAHNKPATGTGPQTQIG